MNNNISSNHNESNHPSSNNDPTPQSKHQLLLRKTDLKTPEHSSSYLPTLHNQHHNYLNLPHLCSLLDIIHNLISHHRTLILPISLLDLPYFHLPLLILSLMINICLQPHPLQLQPNFHLMILLIFPRIHLPILLSIN